MDLHDRREHCVSMYATSKDAKIAQLETERDTLWLLLDEGVKIALLDDWDKALTGRQLWLKDARACLAGSEKNER